MVTVQSLWVLVVPLLVVAAAVARLRRMERREAMVDAGAALAGGLVCLVAAVGLFAAAAPLGAAAVWGEAGSLALVASPVGATLALRLRGRRSIPRALVASTLALGGVVVWLTLHLRGPRGGWSAAEVGLVGMAAALAVGSAACLGWWSKRIEEDRSAGAIGD